MPVPIPIPQRLHARRQLAFSRAELLIVIAVLMLLGFIVLPALAKNRPRSAQVICANNLRQIGIAQQLWGSDHNDLPPVMVPVSEGGTRMHPLAVNTWIHFAWLSNELASARLMFCPSDTGRPAQDFTFNPATGYLHGNFANQATRYFTAYSAALLGTDFPGSIMNGDRNIPTGNQVSSCSYFNAAQSLPHPRWTSEWQTNLHSMKGNIQFRDGRVEMLSAAGLNAALLRITDDNSAKHVSIPR